MAKIYAELVRKGKKNINNVPAAIRENVKGILIKLGLAELAEETEE